MRLGVIASLEKGPEEELKRVHDLGFPTCQVTCWQQELLNEEIADRLHGSAEANDVEITCTRSGAGTTIWTGLPGRYVWDFIEGPSTVGLVPEETREMRLEVLTRA
ncbi:MAG: hypothetical protein U9Q78_03940 [Chloroflexota bacterium]|nr:hypothetical protein [Chloroflexota bacterium]